MTYSIRPAQKSDAALIFNLIKELARYEKMEDQVIASISDLEKTLFSQNPKAYALILEQDDSPAGFALYFYNYSTFLCKHGIYIEDIYVREEFRGKGYGKSLLKSICQIAKENDCGRVEWWCLDWNKTSIDFYLNLGAEAMTDWTVYRLNSDQITETLK